MHFCILKVCEKNNQISNIFEDLELIKKLIINLRQYFRVILCYLLVAQITDFELLSLEKYLHT